MATEGPVISNKALHRTMELEERGLREEEDRTFREAASRDREEYTKATGSGPCAAESRHSQQ
ncbi:hypothetical protein BS47DRAFT_1347648 [Hydnum rufescens UP504]|uniref:Uncharacterized protein n=1 Tax=Hydnum rufescens UP504 TaxID=1448309 RepID=A0A9P6DUK3_9AGAM|nr:hypothetical protein BS47DRAFT_1347648 [Hydnum rufescens UP504]